MGEIGEDRVDVERHAVVGDPTPGADADGGELVFALEKGLGSGGIHGGGVARNVRPRARESLDASRIAHAEVLHGDDGHLLERAHVPVEVRLVIAEVDDGVEDDLAGTVVGSLAATLGAMHLKRSSGVVRVELEVIRGAPRAEGDHRGVLHHEEAIARPERVGLADAVRERVEARLEDGALPAPRGGVGSEHIAHVVQVAGSRRGGGVVVRAGRARDDDARSGSAPRRTARDRRRGPGGESRRGRAKTCARVRGGRRRRHRRSNPRVGRRGRHGALATPRDVLQRAADQVGRCTRLDDSSLFVTDFFFRFFCHVIIRKFGSHYLCSINTSCGSPRFQTPTFPAQTGFLNPRHQRSR